MTTQSTDELKTIERDLLAFMAYDTGCVDSGTHDPERKAAHLATLETMYRNDQDGFRLFLSRLLRNNYLDEASLTAGYGYEDARAFMEWFERETGIDL